jgi:HSP20 family protein
MSITRRTDLFPLSLFDDLLNKDLWNMTLNNNSVTSTTIPAANIRENSDSFIVEMAAPGMTREDFKVELDGNTLTIVSEKNEQAEEKEGERYIRREFSYQSFRRSFQLSKDVVDVDKIEARYQNGVLHLVIPKKDEARVKPPRMIHIN